MTATIANAPEVGSDGDAVVGYLTEVLTSLGGLVPGGGAVTDAVRIDRIAALEKLQGAVAAVQAAETVKFAQSQVAAQQQAVLADPRAVGRGIADQIALACHVSPTEGSRRLGVARALHSELPATARLLRDGRISTYVAGLVVSETRHLDPQQRQAVDHQLAGQPATPLADCAPRPAAMLARRRAYEADPRGFEAALAADGRKRAGNKNAATGTRCQVAHLTIRSASCSENGIERTITQKHGDVIAPHAVHG